MERREVCPGNEPQDHVLLHGGPGLALAAELLGDLREGAELRHRQIAERQADGHRNLAGIALRPHVAADERVKSRARRAAAWRRDRPARWDRLERYRARPHRFAFRDVLPQELLRPELVDHE